MKRTFAAILGVLALTCLSAAPEAWAGPQSVRSVRWIHPDPSTVASFNIHLGSMPGVYDEVISVGKPRKDSDGAFGWKLDLGNAAGRFVAISAVGHDGQQSAISNVGYYRSPKLPELGRPGTPTLDAP